MDENTQFSSEQKSKEFSYKQQKSTHKSSKENSGEEFSFFSLSFISRWTFFSSSADVSDGGGKGAIVSWMWMNCCCSSLTSSERKFVLVCRHHEIIITLLGRCAWCKMLYRKPEKKTQTRHTKDRARERARGNKNMAKVVLNFMPNYWQFFWKSLKCQKLSVPATADFLLCTCRVSKILWKQKTFRPNIIWDSKLR